MSGTKERPILFSGQMVAAILAGTKTQTRRVIKPQPDLRPGTMKGPTGSRIATAYWHWKDEWWWLDPQPSMLSQCPYGRMGDRLWVRENLDLWPGGACYAADGEPVSVCRADWSKEQAFLESYARPHVPSIFMPRWASRITLELTEVRVQRLKDISHNDAIAEGITRRELIECHDSAPLAFRHLWDNINGKRPGCSWADNPFVWCISFKQVQQVTH